jgi:small-conductance mechanosensitive channel
MDWLRTVLTGLGAPLAWLPASVTAALMFALAALVALAFYRTARRLLRRLVADRYPRLLSAVARVHGWVRLALLTLAFALVLPFAPLDPFTRAWLAKLLLIATITLVGWAAIVALRIAADLYLRRFQLETADNLLARKHVTQVRVLQRTADILVIIVTLGAALMTFEPVRQYGVSLFASAGVAGLVAGLAARPVLSNLFAGVQLAMTQPIRLGDSVVVENEFGTIEEITATYVVVRLWDLRRMIVPLSYFIEKPFQNWTRENSALIGAVLFYLDYRAPIAAMRAKLKEILAASDKWDGVVAALQVTDTKETTIEVRALMSARNSAHSFDLRCEVREKMIEFLQREHPEALPHQRHEAAGPAAVPLPRGR